MTFLLSVRGGAYNPGPSVTQGDRAFLPGRASGAPASQGLGGGFYELVVLVTRPVNGRQAICSPGPPVTKPLQSHQGIAYMPTDSRRGRTSQGDKRMGAPCTRLLLCGVDNILVTSVWDSY